MTEKRFKLSEPNGAYLIDGDRPYAHWINDDDKIIDLLNEQNETITRKNIQINYLKRVIYNNEPKIFVQAVFDNLEKIE